MADDATLRARLEEAENALHLLLTGTQEVSVEYEGVQAQYTRSSEGNLRRYIADLRRQLGEQRRPRSRRVIY